MFSFILGIIGLVISYFIIHPHTGLEFVEFIVLGFIISYVIEVLIRLFCTYVLRD